jgi:hypothetical protein
MPLPKDSMECLKTTLSVLKAVREHNDPEKTGISNEELDLKILTLTGQMVLACPSALFAYTLCRPR